MLRSIEDNQIWHPSWGPRPRERQHRDVVVRRLAAGGPQLIPIFGHRYLAGPGDRSGNPILSIYGSDVIVYASGLRVYLPFELGLESSGAGTKVALVPFWQDVIDGLS